MLRPRTTRHGFTAISLVAVIATFLLLLSVVIPALLQVRVEAQNKTLSSFNLGHLALGTHNFHNDYGHFPFDGIKLRPNNNNIDISLHVALLPYIDGKPIYDNLTVDPKTKKLNPPQSGLKSLLCPGRRTVAQGGIGCDYGFWRNADAKDTKYQSILQVKELTITTITNKDGLEGTILLSHLGMNSEKYATSKDTPCSVSPQVAQRLE
jgi:hypothetical protein